MTTPKRIQLRRTKGWRKPEGAIVVARPSKWGNPFRAIRLDGEWLVMDENGVDYQPFHNTKKSALSRAVGLYYDELTYWFGGRIKWDTPFREALETLRGHDLACWCPLDQPCHADVLLELANGGTR